MAWLDEMDSKGGGDKKPGLEIEVDMGSATAKSAAKDLLSAVKGGDVEAIDSALEAWCEAKGYSKPKSDEGEGGDSE
jgi:hypothetical protein